MKERDTVILPVRIKKTLLDILNERWPKSKKQSRNAWVNWSITRNLKSHKRSKV